MFNNVNLIQNKKNDFMNSKISVIMPHFQSECFLLKSVESILGQTHSNLELIFVDDFSKNDDWFYILREFRDDSRLKIYKTDKRVGPYRIKNKVIQDLNLAPYIAFQDSDDISTLERLEIQLKYLLYCNADIVGSSFLRIDSNDNIIYKKRMNKTIKFWLAAGKLFVCHHPTILLRTSVFYRLIGFDGETYIGADSEFIYRASKLYKIRNHPGYLYKYRLHENSLTESKTTGHGSKIRNDYLKKIRNIYKFNDKKKSLVTASPNNINFTLTKINF